MGQAIALAALGSGSTRPNPMVGSVVVRDGSLVGSGYHRRAGEDHAEVIALRCAGERARGATLYVNLEPCIHHGRTPPCTDAILRAGVARVVSALRDPNPAVNGRGFAALQQAGVQVTSGVGENEAERINAPFLKLHRTGRPLVTLKAAVSRDGMIAARAGQSQWITGPDARTFAHRLRYSHDAVLVGAGTARVDDPRMTVRLQDLEMPTPGGPLPVLLSAALRLDPGIRLLAGAASGGPTVRIYTSTANGSRRLPGADIVALPAGPGNGLDLDALLEDLGRIGIRSVLVEGGAATFAGFLGQGLVDRWALFSAPVVLGEDGGTPLVSLPASPSPEQGWWMDNQRSLPLGKDRLTLATAVR
jgi:diaminohydroxyphosphoribosylaminopyrimidine deaminase/5-amino-6-(5-phosphoribosylamino)uracil reductase